MPELAAQLSQCRILIIEDDRTNAAILREHLKAGGYHNLVFAENGSQGLKLTQELRPDLVLLDIVMPKMDGFEYCNSFKEDTSLKGIPIIVQTSLENTADKLRAFAAGACDYVTKPAHAAELLARIRVHLSNKLLREEVLAREEQMHAELRAAQQMQQKLMPSELQMQMMERIYHMDIAHHFESRSVMSGDFWGMRALTETRMAIYMLDFTGHGVNAALNVFRMHTLMQELVAHGNNAGEFLSLLNRHLYPLIDRSEFATMFYGIIDTHANSLEYASAAVPPTLMVRPNAAYAEWLECRGFPLGTLPDAQYRTIYTPFAAGNALVMFSDCMIETVNREGSVIAEAALADQVVTALRESPAHAASHIAERLLVYFRSHAGSAIRDDLTMNVYHRRTA